MLGLKTEDSRLTPVILSAAVGSQKRPALADQKARWIAGDRPIRIPSEPSSGPLSP
jgi:hypothetical protein